MYNFNFFILYLKKTTNLFNLNHAVSYFLKLFRIVCKSFINFTNSKINSLKKVYYFQSSYLISCINYIFKFVCLSYC